MSGCGSCGTKGGLPGGCKNNGWCKAGGCGSILDVHDWLSNVYYVDGVVRHPLVEVKFKGTRKEYYKNSGNIALEIGDAVVVESASSGWDLGYISLTGDLVKLQMKKNRVAEDSPNVRRIVRIATESDLKRYDEAKALEQTTMMQARTHAIHLGLVMKISDVEYQGDKSKATFFYTAEGRVDFRELIKLFARDFRVKVEMRQVGLRQEAGRLGGIGSCGRELCCSTWLTDFHSVPTTAARYQNLFLNPLKLSGQCGRLKCCLNYELDTYLEALEDFPDENTVIKTEKGLARTEKIDILKKIMWFKYMDAGEPKFYALDVFKVQEIISMNAQGIFPPSLDEVSVVDENEEVEIEYMDAEGESSMDRFNNRGRKRGGGRGPQNRNQDQNRGPNPNRNQGPRPNEGQGPNRAPNPNQGPPREGDRPQNPNRNQGQPRRDDRPQGPNPNRNQGPRPNEGQGPNRGPNPNQGPQRRDDRPQNPNPNRNDGPNPNREQNPNRGPNPNRNQGPNQQRGPGGPRNPNDRPPRDDNNPRPPRDNNDKPNDNRPQE